MRWYWWKEGLRSQGARWRIEQKRPHTACNSSLSSSLLKAIMGGGSLKWVATAKSIIFEMLSHKSLGPAYNLVSCFNVIRRHKLVCLIVCHLPGKMSCQPARRVWLSVSYSIDWEWQHQKFNFKLCSFEQLFRDIIPTNTSGQLHFSITFPKYSYHLFVLSTLNSYNYTMKYVNTLLKH